MTCPPLAGLWRRFHVSLPCCLFFLSAAFGPLFAAVVAKAPFDIPADRAENSLKRLSEQSGVEVLFPTDAVAGIRTNAVKGEMTPRAALDAMLSGTGLVAVQGKATGSLTVRKETDAKKNGQRAAQTTESARPAR